jgi:cytochrome b6-f complex iron-sulfur subunit
MTSRCGRQYCFFFLTAFALFLTTNDSFADSSFYSSSISGSSILWAIGFGGLGLLILYVVYLAAVFLIKAIRESIAAKKEASSRPSPRSGDPFLTLVGWILAAFGIFATGTLLVAGFCLLADIDLASTLSISSLIITAGFCLFSLLVLYLLFLSVAGLVKVFRGPVKTEKAVPPPSRDTLSNLPLNPEITRRSFLSLLGWAWVAFTAATMGALSTMLRFAFPNVTFEPPLKFAAGFPNTYSPGVDERFKDAHRCWIVRNDQGFYALSTICTHLGCTPNWLSAEQKFKCPCHGSGFYITGINFEGPAPRPLERFQITLADDGQITIDESVKFQQELGQWGLPGSFLEYKA